jgi:hypothetical protein
MIFSIQICIYEKETHNFKIFLITNKGRIIITDDKLFLIFFILFLDIED